MKLIVKILILTLPTQLIASEFQDLGPIAREALKGFQRQGDALTPNSSAPFFSVRFGTNCSPTYITNDGYFLLALHCITECMEYGGTKRNTKFSALKHEELSKGETKVWVTKINIASAKKLICEISGPTYRDPEGYAAAKPSGLQAHIISMGAKGYISARDYFRLAEEAPAFHEELLKKGFDGLGGVGDFALMKMESKQTKDTAIEEGMSLPGECLPLATTNAPIGSSVWSLTFPAMNRAGRSSTYKPLVTSGKTLPTEQLYAYDPRTFKEAHDGLSLDLESGSSGGSYFDKEGNIRGILVVSAIPEDKYVYGGAVGIKVEHILTTFEKDLGAKQLSKILSGCEMTANTKNLIREITQIPAD